jgi:hypothetical protein
MIQGCAMSTEVNEPITTAIIFRPGQLSPVWFVWKGRRYERLLVTQRWQTQEGQTTLLHLAVTNGATWFELTFNSRTLIWRLAAVEADGGRSR